MSERPERVEEADLHAYVDGWLPEARRALVERWLADHPDEEARLRAFRRHNEALARLAGEAADEPVPGRLDPRRLLRRRRRRWLPYAASVLALFVGVALGWLGGSWLGQGPAAELRLADQAIRAHKLYTPEVRHPVEVRAHEEHLVRWLSRRLGQELRTPDLSPAGFQLVGGRLLPADAGPAAQFMYEDDSGRRITLYATLHPQTRTTAFRYQGDGQLSAFYWVDGRLGYALIGEVERPVLSELAYLVYEQLAR